MWIFRCPQTGHLRYVNAGRNAPILRRAAGLLEKLEVDGMPLGINYPVRYETDFVDLRPSDALIFFTDGVIEAFNDQYEVFGNDRWSSIIRELPMMNAQESLQFLISPLDEFVGATRPSYDITCIVFRSK
jgi:phosphoserine phosphatase RsbU/P